MTTLKINNVQVDVPPGTSVLAAAREIHVNIPTLCYHDDLRIAGNCRVCVVEQHGVTNLIPACATPVEDGMEILTQSPRARAARKEIIALLLSEHSGHCVCCVKAGHCELRELAVEYGVEGDEYPCIAVAKQPDLSSPSIHKDDRKCIRCQRCVRACTDIQDVTALAMAHRGPKMMAETFLDKPMDDVVCTTCGQCVIRCPTGALTERVDIDAVWDALQDPEKHVIVQTAPAIRVSLGEEFRYPPGSSVTGIMVYALRRLGFAQVFDTSFSADLTVIEETYEFLGRLTKALRDGKKTALPLATSCSPGWVKFVEHEFPALLPHLSTCKSPQQMFGALAKTYYATKRGIDPARIVVVAVMPCTAKKFECHRKEMHASGFQDVDYVLTTRELAKLIRQSGLIFTDLEESTFDNILGTSSGAGLLFGATGGVMEAVLRTLWDIIFPAETPMPTLSLRAANGFPGVREIAAPLAGCKPEWSFLEGFNLRLAIANGLVSGRKLCQEIECGHSPFQLFEVMACPGGCIGGGGQPFPTNPEVRKARMDALHAEESKRPIRKAHDNPVVQALYQEWLQHPASETAHRLLHTTYRPRGKLPLGSG